MNSKKKETEKKPSKFDEILKVKGSLDDVLKASVTKKKDSKDK